MSESQNNQNSEQATSSKKPVSKKEKVSKKETGKSLNIYMIFMIFFALLLIGVILFLIHQRLTEKKAEEHYENLSATVREETQDSTTEESIQTTETESSGEEAYLASLGASIPDLNLDWDALKAENPDIYAWIYIPSNQEGEEISYPVLQSTGDEDPDYYLTHNLDGTGPRPACIYSQNTYNSTDFLDYNTVLYGHNMHDGTMFAKLHNYEDATYFDNNRFLYIYTPDKSYAYEIFAAYEFTDAHLFATYGLQTMEDFENYLVMVFSNEDPAANLDHSIEVNKFCHVLTLSTCTRGYDNDRYLVQAVLLNDPLVTGRY